METGGITALLEPRGAAVLARATQVLAECGGDPVRAQERLRTEVEPPTAAAALSQLDLRAHAVAKFGADAHHMFFTRDGLEQATRRRVAAWRAGELAAVSSTGDGPEAVTDLGCGIGADLLAFAAAGLEARGVDRDPTVASLARANAAALGLRVSVEVAEVTPAYLRRLPADTAVFADPARRDGTGRRWSTAGWSPPWAAVRSLLSGDRVAVVKAAPGLPHREIPAGAAADWVSDLGDVVECCLWSPASSGGRRHRRAVLLGGHAPVVVSGDPDLRAPVRGDLGAYLLEPDGAVTRAGLVGSVAEHHGAWSPADGLAYLMTDREPAAPSPEASWFRVVAELPKKVPALRAELRRRGISTLTVKKRGVQRDVEQLRKQLLTGGQRGANAATLVLTPRRTGRGNRLTVLLVEPLR